MESPHLNKRVCVCAVDLASRVPAAVCVSGGSSGAADRGCYEPAAEPPALCGADV